MTINTVNIVDVGRGPQLSTSRITAQDLLPYFQESASVEEIQRWFPSLNGEEISALLNYIRSHLDEVLLLESKIKEYHADLRAAQPDWTRKFDELSLEERRSRLKEKLGIKEREQVDADGTP